MTVIGVLLLGTALFLTSWTNWVSASGELVFAETAVSPNKSILQDKQPNSMPPHPTFKDDACLMCHTDTDNIITFPSGEELPVQVDTAVLAASAHGQMLETPLACANCHQPVDDYQFPHAELTAETVRQYEIAKSETCESCHVQPHLTSHPDAASENPVVCTDCHNSHDVQPAATWQDGANSENCTNCHEAEMVDVSPEMVTHVVENGLFATEKVDNTYCLACHSLPDQTMTFANGDEVSITIDEAALHDSVHGADNSWQALQCTDCHEDYRFPHEEKTAVTARQYNLNQNNLCQRCHTQQFGHALDSVHGDALQEGNLDAAFCTDCHGAHDTPPPNDPPEAISYTCRQCHSTVFDEYADSIHGDALLTEGNPDVPTCINCHGVHDVTNPTQELARSRSPELCADCHTDEELMAEYEISTAVFDTYLADFHGTTALLFEGEEGEEFNKAVCYDCHGVHNIKDPDDPHAGINANLLETCQQCHPDATENFPASWANHYEPSLENNTLVYLVELFYSIVIPVTLVFLTFLVAIDVYGRIRRRRKK